MTTANIEPPCAVDDAMFSSFQVEIDVVHERREKIGAAVREASQVAREILTAFSKVHHDGGVHGIEAICKSVEPKFVILNSHLAKVNELIPEGEFYRHHDMFSFLLQKCVFLVAFYIFLKDGRLAEPADVASIVALQKVPKSDGKRDYLQLDLEDYLIGLLSLGSELSRLSVTCVTNRDYARPIKIKNFLTDLDSGYRVLDLKNDALRRKYDSLKYDVRRVEEVIFDLTVRGLITDKDRGSGGGEGAKGEATGKEGGE